MRKDNQYNVHVEKTVDQITEERYKNIIRKRWKEQKNKGVSQDAFIKEFVPKSLDWWDKFGNKTSTQVTDLIKAVIND